MANLPLQTRVNDLQPRFIEGDLNPQIPSLVVPRTTEDDKCGAGKFVFEGSKPEFTVKSTKDGGTKNDILGVVTRTPFRSYEGKYDDVYSNGANITVVVKGNVCVKVSNTPAYKDKVFVNPTTGEIQTGSADAPQGFIESGYRVSQTKNSGNVVEISNIQF